MKAFGYQKRNVGDGLLEMSEVSFTGSPEEIRMIARFLESAAARMELHGTAFGHDHFRDIYPEYWKKDWPDFIVARES
jgi:esterase/lipase